jgi:hypothetical protein
VDSLVDAGPYGTDNFSESEFAGILSSNLSVPRSALTDWMRADTPEPLIPRAWAGAGDLF